MSFWQEPSAAYDARFEPLAAVTRGELVESVHRGALAVSDAGGRLLGGVGDPHVVVGLRSAAKPFQALAMVDSGAADAFGVTEEELAVICGSHSGEEAHVALVASLLARARAVPADLRCGAQLPLSRAARDRLAGRPPSVLHNMCSGKHAGMLLLARQLGAPLEGYERPGHPVQSAIARTVAELAGVSPDSLLGGRDGCGVPVLHLGLAHAAHLYALLAAAATPGLARVRQAMSAHALLVSGPERLDRDLTDALGDGSVAKSGADGVQAVALSAPTLGAVMKIEDGSHRPVPVLLHALLESWGRGEGRPLADKGALVLTRAGEPAGRVVCLVDTGRLRWSGPLDREAGRSGSALPGLRLVVCDGRERDVNRFRREEWPRADKEILGRSYEWSARRLTLAARLQKELVGVLTGSFIGGVATLEELIVRGDRRGRGVGGELLRRFEAECRQSACHKIVLRTPLGARAETFYLQHGFHRECLLTRHHFGHDYLSMRKDLS